MTFTPKTTDEIVAQINGIKNSDFFGFMTGDLLAFLSFDDAKPFLKEDAAPEKWGEPHPRDYDSIVGKIRDYMPFAWEKANGCRGLSASRSISHMQAWLWLLGEGQAADQIEDYSFYGKPQLRAICERYGIDWQSHDNGRWVNDEDRPDSGYREAAKLDWCKVAA